MTEQQQALCVHCGAPAGRPVAVTGGWLCAACNRWQPLIVSSTRVEPTLRQTILDTYTLRLEDEVRSLRRRRRFWEGMFWCQVPLTVGALIVIVLLVERGR